MKLTWFGGTALRLHLGGSVIVVDPEAASAWVDRPELVSGADRVLRLNDTFPSLDGVRWQPRRSTALIEDTGPVDIALHRLGPGAVLIEAPGEPPLAIVTEGVFAAGRWAADALVLLVGRGVEASAPAVVETISPRLIILAADDEVTTRVLDRIRDRLVGTALLAMEPGLALEV